MNMIATVRSADASDGIFGQLHVLIAGPPSSPDAARRETRQLVSMAMVDTWQADSLWSAADAFHAHFDFLMQTIEINGASDPNLAALRTKCRFYLDQVEALCRSMS